MAPGCDRQNPTLRTNAAPTRRWHHQCENPKYHSGSAIEAGRIEAGGIPAEEWRNPGQNLLGGQPLFRLVCSTRESYKSEKGITWSIVVRGVSIQYRFARSFVLLHPNVLRSRSLIKKRTSRPAHTRLRMHRQGHTTRAG